MSTTICTLLLTLDSLLSLVIPACLKYSTLASGTINLPNIFLTYSSDVLGVAAVMDPDAPGVILNIFLLIGFNGTYVPV